MEAVDLDGHAGPRRRPLPALLAAVPALAWWMVVVGLWTLGALDSGELGYRAWLTGYGGFPRWSQTAFAYLGVPLWILGVLVAGAVVTVDGRRAWPAILGVVAGTGLAAVVMVLLGTWAYPGGG